MKASTKIYPIHIIYGAEDYLIEEEISKLIDQTLTPRGRVSISIFSTEPNMEARRSSRPPKRFPCSRLIVLFW